MLKQSSNNYGVINLVIETSAWVGENKNWNSRFKCLKTTQHVPLRTKSSFSSQKNGWNRVRWFHWMPHTIIYLCEKCKMSWNNVQCRFLCYIPSSCRKITLSGGFKSFFCLFFASQIQSQLWVCSSHRFTRSFPSKYMPSDSTFTFHFHFHSI